MKVSVIGANGQLGSDISLVYKEKEHEVNEINHDNLDIKDFELSRKHLNLFSPDLVINCAAMHHVESCEKEPSQAFAVNGIGARNLSILSEEMGFTLVHFSTDYVFDGLKRSPYVESDYPIPLNVYGNTKLAGEMFVRSIAKRYFLVRVSGLFGKSPCRAKGGLNFIQLMLKLAKERDEVRVVDDEVLSPTYTLSIAEQLEKLTQTNKYGIYHMTSNGSCSWYQFAKKIFELTDTKIKLSIADPNEFPSKVPRPKYSVLENSNLQKIGLDIMPQWEAGLKQYLEQL